MTGVPKATEDFVNHACVRRRFIITDKEYLGLAPIEAKAGDLVYVLFSGQVPFILRVREDSMYTFNREHYVDGIKDGEAMLNRNNGDLVTFSLR